MLSSLHKKGFSLIELMVVLVIVGGLLTLVTTNMNFLVPSSRLNAGARAIASTLILAYNRAAVNGEDAIVSYNLDKQIYQMILMNKGKPDAYTPWTLPEGVRYLDIVAAGERKKTSGIFEVYISPLGIVRAHVVHLQNKEGKQISIEVNPLSGSVEVKDGYQELDVVEEN
ncbi:MAG: prepilin-type N-terminal cleavage/methylation domain-containing protein [Candidatus Brocadiae bacterium]|nr:prepilin-type N-terminal cleavage/methylation domain-containing protein [Candidatus Brocadiia bacterium]